MEAQKTKRFSKLLIPLILIVLGVVFLLENLQILTGNLWQTLLGLWPLLLILASIEGIVNHKRFIEPILLAGLGGVFLLANFKLLSQGVWEAITKLWPILLITLGFEYTIGKQSKVGYYLGLLVVLLLMAGALWVITVQPNIGG